MRSEIHKSRTVHVLVLKEFVNQFTKHGMNNVKVWRCCVWLPLNKYVNVIWYTNREVSYKDEVKFCLCTPWNHVGEGVNLQLHPLLKSASCSGCFISVERSLCAWLPRHISSAYENTVSVIKFSNFIELYFSHVSPPFFCTMCRCWGIWPHSTGIFIFSGLLQMNTVA